MEWKVGQTVQVQSRTWAGINKPGGCARITKVHYFDNSSHEGDDDGNSNYRGKNIQGLDVKYVVGGGFEKNLDPNLVFHFETLQRGGRKRRGRNFLMDRAEDMRKKCKPNPEKKSKGKSAKTDSKEKDVDKKSTTKRRILPIKKERKTESENPQSPTLSSSGPSSPSAKSSPPPHTKRRRKVVKKPAPTKKNPVAPSNNTKDEKPMDVIYAGESIDVSPLDRNHSRKEKKQSPEVRRGLFERSKKSPTDQAEIAAAVKAAATAVVSSKTNAVTTPPTSAIGSSKKHKKKQSKQALQTPISRQRPSSEAPVYETPTQHAHHACSISRHKPLHVAARPLASSASKLQLPRPPPKNAVKPGKSVPLKRVFENEMQKARQFIDDLIKPREADMEEEEDARDPQKASSPSRFVQFMTIFNRIRLRMDDGTIEEEDFVKQVNAEAVRPYEKNEIDTFIDKLSEQGKVMKSDGNIYII